MLSENETEKSKVRAKRKFLEIRKKVSWYDKWTITFRSEDSKFRYHFYSYYCTVGVPGKNKSDRELKSILIGSEDNRQNDIRIKGIARTHGKIVFDNSIDSLLYVKLSEEVTTEEKNNNQPEVIEITDGIRFYIGKYLVEFSKE